MTHVHVNVGGFMGNLLSPVDPIFFMHHSNIDRLWDVWTRKQEKQGLPTLPTGDNLAPWQQEPFLFFINDKGQPVTANEAEAGNYATIGDFNYVYDVYQGGFNPSPVSASRRVSREVKTFFAKVTARALNFTALSSGNFNLSNTILRSAITEDDSRTVVAEITIQPPADVHDVNFNVLVNTPKGERNIDFNSPHFAGTFVFFGKPHHPGPVTFSIPLTSALKALAKQGKLDIDKPIEINVVPDTKGITLRALGATLESVTLESIEIKVF
ncbi:MAG: tyrosinase family protein [Gloeotrichia echinulata GP01]